MDSKKKVENKTEEFVGKVKDKCQEIADKVQAKLAGWDKEIDLHQEIGDKNERIKKLEDEVKYWKEKFDAMWSTWQRLAVQTIGKEEADKMAEQMKAGKN